MALMLGDTFAVTVNTIVYTSTLGSLVVNGDGSWFLGIPAGNSLDEGTYDVQATVTDVAGNSTTDSTTNELIIDLTPPPVPTVNNLITNTGTPTLSGNAISVADGSLSVEVNNVVYSVDDGHLTDNGSGSWDLTIPVGNVLDESTYDVVVSCLLYTSDAADE